MEKKTEDMSSVAASILSHLAVKPKNKLVILLIVSTYCKCVLVVRATSITCNCISGIMVSMLHCSGLECFSS